MHIRINYKSRWKYNTRLFSRLAFSKALHLRPWEEELWREDLSWCQSLYLHVVAEEEAFKAQNEHDQ